MEFNEFKIKLQNHVSSMLKNQQALFTVEIDKDKLWDLYLDSFPAGTNEIFRERREYDCSCCRHFIKSFGDVVIIEDNEIKSIWDFDIKKDKVFYPVLSALSKFIKSSSIKDRFITKENSFGTDYNFEQIEDKVKQWDHFYIKLPKQFVSNSNKSVASLIGEAKDIKNVFKRSLDEISEEAIRTVLELIAQNSLYKGKEWELALRQFLKLHIAYNKLSDDKKDNFCWIKSTEVGAVIGKIKNHSIGVLLTDITEEVDLDQAVKRYEKIVAPSNYKRPKAIFTKKMVEDAQNQLKELGLINSLERRFATIEDITINNILFANKDSINRMTGDIFDDLQKEIPVKTKKLAKTEEISINDFVEKILPSTTNIELLFENKHQSNLISLIAPKNKDSKTLFKWDNNFSWAYNGNITDSMKMRVKAAGGDVEGVLRFSIQWNDDGKNNNDFDAHCIEPNRNEIYFQNKGYQHHSSGMLDVDIIDPISQTKDGIAVENITWSSLDKMQEGKYVFYVHNFHHKGGRTGFSAEIEYDGQIYSYQYNKELRQGEKVIVAEINFNKRKGITFIKSLDSSLSTKEIWNIKTNQFHPVSVCMYSPNYWDEQKGIGNKHYFFMINECKNDNQPNGFFNEFLKEDFLKYKRVFEALGSKMMVEQSDNQLSGLGFSSTQRNSIICKVKGNFNRTIKINF